MDYMNMVLTIFPQFTWRPRSLAPPCPPQIMHHNRRGKQHSKAVSHGSATSHEDARKTKNYGRVGVRRLMGHYHLVYHVMIQLKNCGQTGENTYRRRDGRISPNIPSAWPWSCSSRRPACRIPGTSRHLRTTTLVCNWFHQ